MRETEVRNVFIRELFFCTETSTFYRRIEEPISTETPLVWAERVKDKEVFPFPPYHRVVV